MLVATLCTKVSLTEVSLTEPGANSELRQPLPSNNVYALHARTIPGTLYTKSIKICCSFSIVRSVFYVVGNTTSKSLEKPLGLREDTPIPPRANVGP